MKAKFLGLLEIIQRHREYKEWYISGIHWLCFCGHTPTECDYNEEESRCKGSSVTSFTWNSPTGLTKRNFLHTCVSRRMNRSTDIRSSIPTEQCLAMARVSSDWTWNGGNTPVMNPHPEWWKEGNLALTGLHNTLLPQATWNLYNTQALFQLVIRSYMGPTWCCPIKSIEFIQDGWFPNTWSSNYSNHCEICIICWQKLQLQVRAPSPSCIECKPTRQDSSIVPSW
jgi:hypothetical protein